MSAWCTCGHSDEQHGNTGISSPCYECDCIDALKTELVKVARNGRGCGNDVGEGAEQSSGAIGKPPSRDQKRTIPTTVTRVVVVGDPGGFAERWAEGWEVHIQDDGRTLKLFPRNSTGPRYELTQGFFEGIDPERVEK